MIGGFPHRPEDSFFHLAIERLRKQTEINLIPSLFTMGGFPITRVPKHLKPRCLDAQPHIVLLQFGSSDLIVPLRRRNHRVSSLPVHRNVSTNLPVLVDRLKWNCQSLIGDGLRLEPVTPPNIYLETLNLLARTLVEHRVIPVVLSPFVFGGRRSDRIARDSSGRLQQLLNPIPTAVFVDAYAALDKHPHWRMLLSDGSHLSLEGHQVVAGALFPCLKKLIQTRLG